LGVRWGVSHLSSWLPVERLYESATVLAFYHPRPVYPVHVLIVPKQPIKSLLDLHEGQMELMNEVLLAAQAVICQLNLEESGYRLIVNGGSLSRSRTVAFSFDLRGIYKRVTAVTLAAVTLCGKKGI